MKRTLCTAALLASGLSGAAHADWLSKQPKRDPIHRTVATVAANGCTVTAAQWDQMYAAAGGSERDGDYHVLMMYQNGEMTSADGGGTITLTGVAGC